MQKSSWLTLKERSKWIMFTYYNYHIPLIHSEPPMIMNASIYVYTYILYVGI